MELLTPNGHTQRSPSRGDAHNFTVKGGDREVEDAAWHYPESPVEELRDLIHFDWNAMDGWFEEDEEVFVHPHDPYTRIDILHSSRHVEVEVNGVKIADTHQSTLLFETRLPTRYYIPKLDVRMDLLIPTDTVDRPVRSVRHFAKNKRVRRRWSCTCSNVGWKAVGGKGLTRGAKRECYGNR